MPYSVTGCTTFPCFFIYYIVKNIEIHLKSNLLWLCRKCKNYFWSCIDWRCKVLTPCTAFWAQTPPKFQIWTMVIVGKTPPLPLLDSGHQNMELLPSAVIEYCSWSLFIKFLTDFFTFTWKLILVWKIILKTDAQNPDWMRCHSQWAFSGDWPTQTVNIWM